MHESALPGFYPDSNDPAVERWWDGQEWAEVTRPVSGRDAADLMGEGFGGALLPLPANPLLRFWVLRSDGQMVAFALLFPLLLFVANALLPIVSGVYLPQVGLFAMLLPVPLLGYAIVGHSVVRRRYGRS